MEVPLISVVIPFYKGEQYIGETLDSILQSGYKNLEVIVVNDGSPRETLGVLESYSDRIKILSQENKGQADARNLGIKEASGSVIALIDQDDLWPSGRTERMLTYLLEGDYDFVRGQTQMFRVSKDGTKEMKEPDFKEALVGSALYRAEVFRVVGLFEEGMRVGEDFDWNIRLRECGCREKRISDVTLYCRRHDSNQSSMKDFIKKGQMLSLKKKLERARAQSNS